MQDQKTFLVVTAIVNKENAAELPTYLEQVKPLFGKYGAQPVGSFKTIKKIAGDESPEMVSISAFESVEAIETLVNSEEFKSLAELRARVFSKLNLVISQS